MSRKDLVKKQTGGVSNPASMYPKWDSEAAAFSYWRKDESLEKNGENVIMQLPVQFALAGPLFASIGGWSKSMKSGFYSNEILASNIQTEQFHVRSFKKDANFEKNGLWADLKPEAEILGLKFFQHIYAMNADGELARFELKGQALYEFGEFMKTMSDEQRVNNWIVVNEYEDRKNGSTKYTVPVFQVGDEINKKDGSLADKLAEKVEAYIGQMKEAKENFDTTPSSGSAAHSSAKPDDSVMQGETVADDTVETTADEVAALKAELAAQKAATRRANAAEVG